MTICGAGVLLNSLVCGGHCRTVIQAIFFDAVGTLFSLNGTVGDHYALVGREVGLDLPADQLDRAFAVASKRMPPRRAIGGPRQDDDKPWWRDLLDVVLTDVAPTLNE